MREKGMPMPSYSSLINTKYFNPAFNSAIYDGPIRIYFAQLHESLALKIYFAIQQSLSEEWSRAREISKVVGGNIHILIYPNEASYLLSFSAAVDGVIQMEILQSEIVIGLRGPIEDRKIEELLVQVKNSIENWPHLIQPEMESSIHLQEKISENEMG